MKVLIIGYGSIGKRHENVLEKMDEVSSIDIITKQKLKNKSTFSDLNEVTNLNFYDYFIIASQTNKHYSQLKILESKVTNKIIFCEKPIFETKKEISIKNNKVFVGYVLRFHPLLLRLKSELVGQSVISVNVNCGQYLPTWRPERDYRTSYSSKKDKGGGVLLDLSHEIDYVQWLFGKVEKLSSLQGKISDLDIDSDDITTFIGKTSNNVLINLSVDYISKITNRRMLIHTLEKSYELDFIKNTLIENNKENIEKKYLSKDLERNYMFEKMHSDIFSKKLYVCQLNEALDVMDTIFTIQEQNNDK